MNFDYNTSRPLLKLPEYGRNIQKMVNQIMEINDRAERNKAAHGLIQIMGNMNPHLRDVADFKRKLWDHLAIMSNFQLDIDYPVEPIHPSTLKEKPKKVEYFKGDTQYKHYGKIIESFLFKAVEMEDGEEKNLLIELIANQMKKAYLSWNKDVVSDETIFKDIQKITRGKIVLNEETLKLADPREAGRKKKKPMVMKRKDR
ncbi:MAG: DUF4290 domain-containing protein [Bacteroidales bacterium]|nr:DUF4290 domain-containing protein [Bacteroidales bacterium]